MNEPYPKFTYKDDDGNYITLYEGKTRVDVLWADKEIQVNIYTSPYNYSEIPHAETSCFSYDKKIDNEHRTVNDIKVVTPPIQAIQTQKNVNPDIVFLESIKDLPVSQLTLEINKHLYDRIVNSIPKEMTTINLKVIVSAVMLSDITRELWATPSSIKDAMNSDNLAISMININSAQLKVSDLRDPSCIIMTHISTHIAVLNNAYLIKQDGQTVLDNSTYYDKIYNTIIADIKSLVSNSVVQNIEVKTVLAENMQVNPVIAETTPVIEEAKPIITENISTVAAEVATDIKQVISETPTTEVTSKVSNTTEIKENTTAVNKNKSNNNNIQEVKATKQLSLEDKKFLEQIKVLDLDNKAGAIDNRIYTDVCNLIQDLPGTPNTNTVKSCIFNYLVNDNITKPLWLSTTEKDIANPISLSNRMLSINLHHLTHNPEFNIAEKKIVAHISTQIELIHISNVLSIDVKELITNNKVYLETFRKYDV